MEGGVIMANVLLHRRVNGSVASQAAATVRQNRGLTLPAGMSVLVLPRRCTASTQDYTAWE